MTENAPPIESKKSKRWYQRWWVWAIAAVVVLAAIGGSMSESDEAEDAAADTTTTVEAEETTTTTSDETTTTSEATTTTSPTEETTTSAAETTTTLGIPGTLGMTPDEFRSAWNEVVEEAEMLQLLLPPLEVEDGAVQDVVSVMVVPHIALNLTVNKADGTVRDGVVLAEASTDPNANSETLVAWGTFFRSTTVPPSGPEHSAEVFDALGLLDGDFEGLDAEAVVADVQYTATFSSELGLFLVSAADPSDSG